MTRIFMVEDDADLLDSLALVLRLDGFDVVTATSNKGAHAIIDRGGLDLIVADSVLRGGNGDDIAKTADPGRTRHPHQRQRRAHRAVARRPAAVHRQAVSRRRAGRAGEVASGPRLSPAHAGLQPTLLQHRFRHPLAADQAGQIR
jgi:hypothetical protein